MSVLDRLPLLTTTGIGSLPFDEPIAAVRHATRAYGLPFCPQLPRRDGDMVREWLGADPLRCGWADDRDRERPAAWDAFLAAIEARPPEHRLVKLQVTGPVTLARALEHAAGRTGADGLARELAAWLAGNLAGQVARLRELGLDALVVIDEPGLAAAAGSGIAPDVWDPLRAVAAAWGLHVCGPVPWALVRAAEPDVVSFDVTRYCVGGEGAAVLSALLRRGTRVAWGAVDPVSPDDVCDVAARVSAGVAATVAAGAPLATVYAQSLVTPACGTGRLAADRERLVASLVAAGAETAGATWRSQPGARVG
ncbi:MAG: hypothetical protein ITG02_12650 [Patulibacter sp.]|nr:hypothetical protein [Patulibacter sp.]